MAAAATVGASACRPIGCRAPAWVPGRRRRAARGSAPRRAMTATAIANSRGGRRRCSGRLKNRRRRSTIVPVVAVEGFALAFAQLAGAAHDVLVRRPRRRVRTRGRDGSLGRPTPAVGRRARRAARRQRGPAGLVRVAVRRADCAPLPCPACAVGRWRCRAVAVQRVAGGHAREAAAAVRGRRARRVGTRRWNVDDEWPFELELVDDVRVGRARRSPRRRSRSPACPSRRVSRRQAR